MNTAQAPSARPRVQPHVDAVLENDSWRIGNTLRDAELPISLTNAFSTGLLIALALLYGLGWMLQGCSK